MSADNLSIPKEVVIEVTASCNFNCPGCFNLESFASEGRFVSLKLEKVKRIIDSAADMGVPLIRFTGGEALLHPDLFSMAAYAKKKNVHTRLNTNASLIGKDIIGEIANLFDSVLVSVNGADMESDAEWTGVFDSFDSKLHGLKLLAKTDVELRIGTVLTNENIENLEKIYKLIEPLKPAHWEVYRMVTSESREEIAEKIEIVLTKLACLGRMFGQVIPIVNAIPFCLYDKEVMNKMCSGASFDDGHSRIIVDPRGFAKPSYYINENIGDPTDIKACWNHPFMLKMRSLSMLPEECKSCEFSQRCKGGSRYKAKIAFGDYFARDPLMRTWADM